jgi:3-hydroxybutyryl-CoA dehydratase
MLEPGAIASRTRTITAHEIDLFAQASGDFNPLHMDEAYAATTPFGRRVAHGMLTASLISAVLANDLPGPGSIFLSQSLQFKAPVFIGDTITAAVEVLTYRSSRRIATLRTRCVNQAGTVVLEGEAMVIAPPSSETKAPPGEG